MNDWLVRITEVAVTVIDGMALLVILWGTVQAFIGALGLLLSGPDDHRRRQVWLRYARWLVAALTFQLAADVIETSIRVDWESIARLGAIAVIRTFLNYFLEKDLEEASERQHEASGTEKRP